MFGRLLGRRRVKGIGLPYRSAWCVGVGIVRDNWRAFWDRNARVDLYRFRPFVAGVNTNDGAIDIMIGALSRFEREIRVSQKKQSKQYAAREDKIAKDRH